MFSRGDGTSRPPPCTMAPSSLCGMYADVTFMAGSHNTQHRDAGKLRIRESYVRPLEEEEDEEEPGARPLSTTALYVIPDATAWRTYLPWITELCRLLSKQQEKQSTQQQRVQLLSSKTSSSAAADPPPPPRVHIVLLESVVQEMELRNQAGTSSSSSLQSWQRGKLIPEAASPHERTKMVRLVRDQASAGAPPPPVVPFCDLSVRDLDVDEYFDTTTNDYDDDRHAGDWKSTTLTNRRRRLLGQRAARLLRLQQGGRNAEVLLWFHEEEEEEEDHDIRPDDNDKTRQTVQHAHTQPQYVEEEGVQFVNAQSLLQILQQQALPGDAAVQVAMDRLRIQCQREYRQRQEKQRQSTSRTSSTSSSAAMEWTDATIADALQSGHLGRGRFQVSKENPAEACVSWKDTMWLVVTTSNNNNSDTATSMAHAIDQDIVIVEPLPKPQWRQPVGRRRLVAVSQQSNSSDDDGDDGNGTAATDSTSRSSSSNNTVPTARLLRVDQPGPRRLVVATLTKAPTLADESAVLLTPMDIRIPRVRIPTKEWQKWLGQRVLVQISSVWEVNSKYPAGHVHTIVGAVGDLETEITCLLHEHRIPLDPWSLASRACLPRADWSIPAEEVRKRRDLRRTHNIFSVDPVGCQDIDDCMHARRLPNGDVEIGVHIADVTHFVPLNSALDVQARRRGTTFYLVDRRFDMLPAVLSSNLCSLHGGTDRLAVSVIWTLTEDMRQVLTTWYGRTVIHNVAAMTYDQADRILQGEPPELAGQALPPPLTAGGPVNRALVPRLRGDLEILTRLARQRRQHRQDYGGAVELSSGDTGSELKFTLVNGEPVKVQPKQTKEIHRTIEELMIWANTSVASKIKQTYPNSALLRIHRTVEEERFDDLKGLLAAGDIAFKGKTNAELAESLEKAQARSEKTVASLFRSLATRAMSEALYVSTGSIASADRLAHYGLGLKEYTHFTSPIRRYADVIVHHQLLAALPRTEEYLVMSEAPRKPVLASLPGSTVMSIMGDDIVEVTDDERDIQIDALVGDAADDVVLEHKHKTKDPELPRNGPFVGDEVARICEHLNEHNRLAKHSSTDCQGLFLSLYFRNHVEYAQAVVTDLRENGFFCYVPKFDMKGPVFLRDMEGHVQIDPAFFDLSPTSGSDPTGGFTSADFIRRFDPTESEIWFKENECLEVFVRCRTFALHPLDVVTVSISCTDWDNRARVPLPRIQLARKEHQQHPTAVSAGQSGTSTRRSIPKEETVATSANARFASSKTSDGASLFDLLERLPSLDSTDKSTSRSSVDNTTTSLTSKTVSGRLSWGGFVNPDTRSAAQAAAQEAAVRSERPAGSSDYDMNNRVAREVTSRQQRLAAEKRNARRTKRN